MTNYEKAFQHFLDCTDEKSVLLSILLSEIRRRSAQSVLDIGAGNGAISIPLAQSVHDYTAIEPNEAYAKALRKAHVQVLQKEFPFPLQKRYDFVCISHSVPYHEEQLPIFLKAAWKLVGVRGELFLVTYGNADDDWAKFARLIGYDDLTHKRKRYRTIMGVLSALGRVNQSIVVTTVRSSSAEALLRALAFVACYGNKEKEREFFRHKQLLLDTLERQYRTEGEYVFPFRHYCIIVERKKI